MTDAEPVPTRAGVAGSWLMDADPKGPGWILGSLELALQATALNLGVT